MLQKRDTLEKGSLSTGTDGWINVCHSFQITLNRKPQTLNPETLNSKSCAGRRPEP